MHKVHCLVPGTTTYSNDKDKTSPNRGHDKQDGEKFWTAGLGIGKVDGSDDWIGHERSVRFRPLTHHKAILLTSVCGIDFALALLVMIVGWGSVCN